MKTLNLDPEWTVARKWLCGHVQHACCRDHLDESCPLGCPDVDIALEQKVPQMAVAESIRVFDDNAPGHAWLGGRCFRCGVHYLDADEPCPWLLEADTFTMLPLSAVLAGWSSGTSRGWAWDEEFDFMESENAERVDMLCNSIQTDGIRVPIDLGHDGRVWDGHHRLTAAVRLALPDVPVHIHAKVAEGSGADVEKAVQS